RRHTRFSRDWSSDVCSSDLFYYMARGAGKNGLVSALSNYFISELHGIDFYGVSIVANSEKQAKTSFTEVYNAIDMNDELKSYFRSEEHTSELQSRENLVCRL